MITSSRVRSIKANGGDRIGTLNDCRKDIGQRVWEIIQIDSAHVELPDGRFILSKGYVRLLVIGEVWLSRIMVRRARVFFLKEMLDKTPFKMQVKQTDRGSEFRSDFEIAVKNCGLGFFNLPPKSPKLNPHVEGVNRT